MMHFPMLLCNKHYCFFIVGISFSPNLLALVLETPDPIPEPHNRGKRSWQLRPLARCVRPLKQPRPLCLFVVFGKSERREHVRLFKAVSGVGKAFLVEGWLWTQFGTLAPKSGTEQRGSVLESRNARELIVFRSKGPRDEVMLAARSPKLQLR